MSVPSSGHLTAEHAHTWVILLLRAAAVTGLAPTSTNLFHRLVFLSNSLAQLYGTAPPSEFVLKHRRGPFYPKAEFSVERLVVQGLVQLGEIRWVKEEDSVRMESDFSLTRSGQALVDKCVADSEWCSSVLRFLTDLCTAVASVKDGHEISVADADLTYDQTWAKEYTVIAFRNPEERLSERGAKELSELCPKDLRPNKQHQLRLYLKYLERLAA